MSEEQERQEVNLTLFSLILVTIVALTRLGYWLAFYHISKMQISWEFSLIVVEFLVLLCSSLLITMFGYLEFRKLYVGKLSKIKKWLSEIQEYNKNIREQKRKNQELFESEQSTRILDEDLEDDLNRSWAHYESKKK